MTDRRIRVIQGGDMSSEAELSAILDAATVRILLPPGEVAWRHQVLAEALVDQLSRLFPRLDIVCDSEAEASPDLPPGPPLLVDRLEATREHGIAPDTPTSPTLTIGVGQVEEANLWCDGDGWQSYIGAMPSRLASEGHSRVPIGPLAAACRVAAHAFTRVMGEAVTQRPLPDCIYSSALGYRHFSDPLVEPDLEFNPHLDAVLVGAGSVGGAAAYAFARTPSLRGLLEVVDYQTLEAKNLDRALLATRERSAREEVKSDVVDDALSHLEEFHVTPHQLTVGQWLATRPRTSPLPLVLCAVDSAAARRAVQDCLPLHLLNAACHPAEVTVSRHVTGNGPCVCCLHMSEVLDGGRIKARLIAEATGFNFQMVVALLVGRTPLAKQHLRGIELHRRMEDGALGGFEGRTLEDLWNAQLLYGAATVRTAGGVAVVAAPWVTALAGVLLASEALKEAAGDAYEPYRLGPRDSNIAVKYEENPYASPEFALQSTPARWATSECLCRSPRRARLVSERYGGPVDSD